ncbi:MAG: VOC family protein [Bacillota bacterium]|jgi:lactoylglutathione lyase|nr:VOC family protein [Bacillota bacterium]
MKFLWCTINVKDMEESIRFYEEVVGLKVVNRFSAGPTEIAFLGEGETKVELIHDGSDKWQGNKTGISLGFEAESLDGMMELVKEKGIEITGGPFQPGPDFRFFFIKDPNGVTIQFGEHITK